MTKLGKNKDEFLRVDKNQFREENKSCLEFDFTSISPKGPLLRVSGLLDAVSTHPWVDLPYSLPSGKIFATF